MAFLGVRSIEEVEGASEKEEMLELLFSSLESDELSSNILSRRCFFTGVSFCCLCLFESESELLD